MDHEFEIINKNKVDVAWKGAPIELVPETSVHMPKTPSGPLIFVYRTAPELNQMASLTLKSEGDEPRIIMIQPGSDLPGVYIHDWEGRHLCVTNISHAKDAKISMTAFGVIPGVEIDSLPMDQPRKFNNQTSARSASVPGLQQLAVKATSKELTLFAIIAPGSDDEGAEVYVYAVNARENTGPGTGKEAPPGYYSTTTASNLTYESIGKGTNEEQAPLYLMNISLDPAAAEVLTRRL